MERKLASIQTVKSVIPIFHPGDGTLTNLELITFENIGWQCVAKRGEFQAGDKAVYIEISAIVPEHPVFEFLRARKFKVKTIRLLGVLSQGLALPVRILGEFDPIYLEFDPLEGEWVDGADVTDVIGVTRYEPPQEVKLNGGGVVRPFPVDIAPKTDEVRVQSMPHVLKELAGLTVIATLKIDGTSATYFWDEEMGRMRVCSRNMEKCERDESVYWGILDKFPSITAFCQAHPNFVLQGEIAGPGIQKNRLQLKDVAFYAFNLWDRISSDYIPANEMFSLLALWGVPEVPIVEIWRDFDLDVEDLLENAKGNYPQTNNPKEGIVIRPFYEEKFSYLLGGRVSCKVINNEFLLAGGE